MLREKLYPDWALRQRIWWSTGRNRLIMFIVCVVCGHIPIACTLFFEIITWDDYNTQLHNMSELGRCYFATLIFTFDMTNIMQVYPLLCIIYCETY